MLKCRSQACSLDRFNRRRFCRSLASGGAYGHARAYAYAYMPRSRLLAKSSQVRRVPVWHTAGHVQRKLWKTMSRSKKNRMRKCASIGASAQHKLTNTIHIQSAPFTARLGEGALIDCVEKLTTEKFACEVTQEKMRREFGIPSHSCRAMKLTFAEKTSDQRVKPKS